MRNGKFSHLEENESIKTRWWDELFYRSISKIAFRNRLTATYIKWIEVILVTTITKIKKIETYYRP